MYKAHSYLRAEMEPELKSPLEPSRFHQRVRGRREGLLGNLRYLVLDRGRYGCHHPRTPSGLLVAAGGGGRGLPRPRGPQSRLPAGAPGLLPAPDGESREGLIGRKTFSADLISRRPALLPWSAWASPSTPPPGPSWARNPDGGRRNWSPGAGAASRGPGLRELCCLLPRSIKASHAPRQPGQGPG